MNKWHTFDGRIVTFEEMEHQHMSNIYWFINYVRPELYHNTTKFTILKWLHDRFNGSILDYRPVPEFTEEKEFLIRKGYLTLDNSIVINGEIIGRYEN